MTINLSRVEEQLAEARREVMRLERLREAERFRTNEPMMWTHKRDPNTIVRFNKAGAKT